MGDCMDETRESCWIFSIHDPETQPYIRKEKKGQFSTTFNKYEPQTPFEQSLP